MFFTVQPVLLSDKENWDCKMKSFACETLPSNSMNFPVRDNKVLLYCIVLYCIVLYCIVLYCIVLYCIVLYCIVLYCIVLYCIVLYCIV